ncbi:sugar transferase [Leifsonia sp. F6_8S_P_1B]|uniref:Sugar transferase n=1 Tax=Leifsonia williamsii TaxID=3035919 RepID=A0ABT8KF85_9MICO|nr:sugar transferase [Leifsonia williamsii]MDN4616089.1 sugar transferase [Leifsonia williamsii]
MTRVAAYVADTGATRRSAGAVAIRLLPVTDALAVVSCLLFAHLARFGVGSGHDFLIDRFRVDYSAVTALTAVVWVGALYLLRPRDAFAFGRGAEDWRSALRASGAVFTGCAFLTMLLQLEPSRAFLLYAFPAGTVMVLASRWAWRRWVRLSVAESPRPTLVIGTAGEVERIERTLLADPLHGLRVVASVGDRSGEAMAPCDEDWFSEVRETARLHGVEAVVVGSLPTHATTASSAVGLRRLAWELEPEGVQLLLAPGLESVTPSRIDVLHFAESPVILVRQPSYAGGKYIGKRVLDVVLAVIGLIVTAPLMAAAACAIRREDGGRVFFRQQRVGVDGRPFTILKLRSMQEDADRALHGLAALNEADGPLFKVRADPRVTRVGRFLRRYSIDELPQLWNVLRGDMSIVGPRPPLPRETARYENSARRRLLVKPGLTGPWQVSGRSDLAWEEGLLLDLSYVENWSVSGDLRILAKTVRAVLSRTGAY